ncbi:MAG: tyrosine-type recombinase/integrase [Paracoccaceae bacterium]
MGQTPVAEIDQRDIRDTLAPIWHDKADTARKAMSRLGIVMRYAAALGLGVDLQATDKAKALLGKQRHTAKHIPAMPWVDVPAFYQSLTNSTLSELALRLLILTAARSGPLRHIHESQIDGDIWTIPSEARKAAWVPRRISGCRCPARRWRSLQKPASSPAMASCFRDCARA